MIAYPFILIFNKKKHQYVQNCVKFRVTVSDPALHRRDPSGMTRRVSAVAEIFQYAGLLVPFFCRSGYLTLGDALCAFGHKDYLDSREQQLYILHKTRVGDVLQVH